MKLFRSLYRTHLVISLASLLILAISFYVSFYYLSLQHYKDNNQKIKKEYVEYKKDIILNRVNNEISFIKHKRSQIMERTKKNIKSKVYQAHDIAESLYQRNKENLSDEKIQELIINTLRPIRFNNGNGYYFIVNLSGIELLYPTQPEMEGKNVYNLQDSKGNYVIQEEIQTAKEQGQGFVKGYWKKPSEEHGKDYPKISFVKLFEPYDWYIGTGRYLDNTKEVVQSEILEWFKDFRYSEDGYIFVLNKQGILLSHPIKKLVNKDLENISDPHRVDVLKELLKIVKSKNSGFMEYKWVKPSIGKRKRKLTYVQEYEPWDWIVGTGVYLDDIDKMLAESRTEYKEIFYNEIYAGLLLLLFFSFCTILFISIFSKRIKLELNKFKSFFVDSYDQYAEIDKSKLYFEELSEVAHYANKMNMYRKQAEDDLRQSETYYRTIFEASGSAMLIVEEDTTITLVNSNFEELSGYSREEIEGKKSWNDFVYSIDAARRRQSQDFQHYPLADAPRQYEIRLLTRHSEVRDVFLSLDRIPGTNQSIISCIDITQRKQMEEKLMDMSFLDSLTGLYNRNFFEEEMKRLFDGRHNPLGIIVCDLDGLKFINDTLGHQAGDQMLTIIAEILRNNFRSSDIIARIGGDEFAVLLTETDSEVVKQILQRLRQAVQDYNSVGPEIPLSLSLGHAVSEGETAEMQSLFREADHRMYREKIQREGSARSDILQAITRTMQARDFDTEGHCERLQELAASLARSLDLSQEFINDLYLLARFHDLGKVGIPDHILFKPGPLTEEEWRQMRQHCEVGHRIASSVPDLEPVADYILKHHEWWDGRGYPLGLAGEDIPLPCRILAIVDAYDAMTSDRPYRKAMSQEEAITELRRCAGTQFDPELVEEFIKILEEADEG